MNWRFGTSSRRRVQKDEREIPMRIPVLLSVMAWPIAGLAAPVAAPAAAEVPFRLAAKKVQKKSEAVQACRELEPKGKWELADRATVLEAIGKGLAVTTVYIDTEQWREKKGSFRNFFFSSDALPKRFEGDRTLNVIDGQDRDFLDLREFDILRQEVGRAVVVPDEVEYEIRGYQTWLVLKNGKDLNGDPLPPEDVGPEPVISKEAREIIEKKQSALGQSLYDWMTKHFIPTFEAGLEVVCRKVPTK
jgi:hypothetical protein